MPSIYAPFLILLSSDLRSSQPFVVVSTVGASTVGVGLPSPPNCANAASMADFCCDLYHSELYNSTTLAKLSDPPALNFSILIAPSGSARFMMLTAKIPINNQVVRYGDVIILCALDSCLKIILLPFLCNKNYCAAASGAVCVGIIAPAACPCNACIVCWICIACVCFHASDLYNSFIIL